MKADEDEKRWSGDRRFPQGNGDGWRLLFFMMMSSLLLHRDEPLLLLLTSSALDKAGRGDVARAEDWILCRS